MILSGVLTSIFMAFNYANTLVNLFTFIILLSTLSVLLPLAVSALAEMKFLLKERPSMPSAKWLSAFLIAGLAFTYSLWAIAGSGWKAAMWGAMLLLVGVFFFYVMKRKI